jgi:hypothetical protein
LGEMDSPFFLKLAESGASFKLLPFPWALAAGQGRPTLAHPTSLLGLRTRDRKITEVKSASLGARQSLGSTHSTTACLVTIT